MHLDESNEFRYDCVRDHWRTFPTTTTASTGGRAAFCRCDLYKASPTSGLSSQVQPVQLRRWAALAEDREDGVGGENVQKRFRGPKTWRRFLMSVLRPGRPSDFGARSVRPITYPALWGRAREGNRTFLITNRGQGREVKDVGRGWVAVDRRSTLLAYKVCVMIVAYRAYLSLGYLSYVTRGTNLSTTTAPSSEMLGLEELCLQRLGEFAHPGPNFNKDKAT
ncbi:hypothetical protein FIBSPDRAFT_888090 [Athelia psychrophila]|uniref:Uncharacterized protein n=1 Tax=Athelia psychrophila TaxID=1759441 RepID=A0A166NQ51_9AGAM|nr:hypothetical protein FIBSPDRAFT_888090 [Fibularhizoctonia sp. CBS 109695]